MATIKTITENGQTFVLTKNGNVSCECCCNISGCVPIPSFSEVDICFTNSGRGVVDPSLCDYIALGSAGELGSDWYNSPFPLRFRRRGACLRYYYRVVNEFIGENGTVYCEGNIGPAGTVDGQEAVTTGFNYREDKSNLLEGESCGLYVYVISFRYWHSICSGSLEGGFRVGGAEPPDCTPIKIYNVEMYDVFQYLKNS